jgi:lipopolysaccharide/colanic/teichoic acid biosynthesis glycosyltransferase
VKRLFDVAFALLLLVVLSPLLLLLAFLVKWSSEGPILFTQKRVGLHCKEFEFYKFRTMCVDAEKQKESLLDQNERSGPHFKMTNDPRVTPIGRLLRKHSLDELPQLINILNGEMSFVGPRPNLLCEVAEYSRWHFKRFRVLPGLTCLWQISPDRNMSLHKWMDLDIKYVENNNWLLDLKLILKTIPVVFKGQSK